MLLLVSIPAILVCLGIAYQWIGARRDARSYPAPGAVYDIGGTRLHLLKAGQGAPAVIFESGVAASSVSWRPVQDRIARHTCAAAYDRAGFAWSGPAALAQDPRQMNAALRLLLQRADLRPPYILVGHSFGALLVRLFASQYPGEVVGLVLIDSALTQEWANPSPERLRMLGRGISLSRRGAMLARIGFVRFSLSMLTGGLRFLPKLLSKLSSGRGHSVSERLVGEVRKLPSELWPAVQSHWCRPESFESMARHLEQLPATAALVSETNPIPSIPVTVISGGHLTEAQRAEHEAIAKSSTNGRHIIAENSGHWVHLDRPDLVVTAIHDMLKLYS